MNTVTIEQFLDTPGKIIRDASVGEPVKVTTGGGNAAIIIDEGEWTMLRQALVLCMEHPEWTSRK